MTKINPKWSINSDMLLLSSFLGSQAYRGSTLDLKLRFPIRGKKTNAKYPMVKRSKRTYE